MLLTMETKSLDTQSLIDICRRNDGIFLGVFGSFARGDASEDSDVDLLIRFSTRKGLLDLVRIEREMAESLGRSVDLLTDAAISPYLREHINRELVELYHA